MSNKKIQEKLNASTIPNEFQWLVEEIKILIDANERFQDDKRKSIIRFIHSECCERK